MARLAELYSHQSLAKSLLAFLLGSTVLNAQVTVNTHVTVSGRPLAANVIVPQSRAFAWDRHAPVQITEVAVGVVILEQVATTTMDISLSNPGSARTEGELLVPVPEGAAVRGFTFQGGGAEPTAKLLRKEEARRIYDSIVAKSRDPALLEFVGCNLIRSSVFPIDARGTQKVRLTYEHLLAADGNRVDYVLPRSESLQYSVPWKVSVQIRSKRPVSTVYSPSHALETGRKGPNEVTVRIADSASREPGAFRLSYLLEAGAVTASLLAYPDPKTGGGYFLLLAGLPAGSSTAATASTAPAIKREVTLVIDHSGSMNGE
jgi:Ca-activated chloride channel homolog